MIGLVLAATGAGAVLAVASATAPPVRGATRRLSGHRSSSPPGWSEPLMSMLFVRRRVRNYEVGLVAVLESLARALRTGASERQALSEAAAEAEPAVADDVGELLRRVQHGQPLADALTVWPALRPEVAAVGSAVRALRLALDAGGSAAAGVDSVADTLRADVEQRGEVAAMASQARASAALVAALPLLFLAIAGSADSSLIGFLAGSSLGRSCLLAGLALDVAGWWWMRRIVATVRT